MTLKNKRLKYVTKGGIAVIREQQFLPYKTATDNLATALNDQRGVFLSSSFEYPGRYSRWDLGFINPPIEIMARQRYMQISALNDRGEVLIPAIYQVLKNSPELHDIVQQARIIRLNIKSAQAHIAEEQRSQLPSVFSVLRRIIQLFKYADDTCLGLYGAFGYELCFQFESIKTVLPRTADARDLVLYIPDRIILVDHRAEDAFCFEYDFESNGKSTQNKERSGEKQAFVAGADVNSIDDITVKSDHKPGEYADCVREALQHFARGDLFEVVPGQVFTCPCVDTPAAIFTALKSANPAPYGALINLGQQEYLVAASPEMYIRVEGRRIETCPISGTIKRGKNALEDAKQIRLLLNSIKEESELTMCTDVDRNDKSRICEPESIRLLGRRQIEMYSRLIHTVDHVEGMLREGFDALDGFLAHTWAVTVTGAPKHAAIQFIEDHEKSPRLWYGGAIGRLTFDGDVNTGLTLRTMRIKDGIAQVRAGATLLFGCDPQAEEEETHLKASALLDIIRPTPQKTVNQHTAVITPHSKNSLLNIVMVDHQDSFVHTLGGYLRITGANVITMRPEMARQYLATTAVDLLVLSPGPGQPKDFALQQTIQIAETKAIPVFGVCLGLQGLIEYFGGSLKQLNYPYHGKPDQIFSDQKGLFKDLPASFTAGRYHSLCADQVPAVLKVTASTKDQVVMAVQHVDLPMAAVQFHPESILSQEGNIGQQLIFNVLSTLL